MNTYLIVLISFLLVTLNAQAKILERVEAVVEGRMVLKSDISTFKKKFKDKKLINQNLIDLVGLKKKPNDKEVLDFLILKKLLVVQSSKEKGEISLENFVKKEIAQLARQNNMTPEQLKREVLSQGINYSDYKSFISESSLIRSTIERNVVSQVRPDEEDFVSYLKKNNIDGIASSYIYNLEQIFIPLTNKEASSLASKINSKNFRKYFSNYESYGIDAVSLGKVRLVDLSTQHRNLIKDSQANSTSEPLKEESGYRIFYISSKKTSFNIPNTPQIQSLQRVFYDKLIKQRFKDWSKTVSSLYFVRINS